MPQTVPSLSDYAAAVGELVLHLREEGSILSSIDQHLVATWWEAGYPLDTVLRVVRATGERLKRRKRPPRGLPLSSMRKVVEKAGIRALARGAAATVGQPVDGLAEGAALLEFAAAELRGDTRDEPPGRRALLARAAQSLADAAQGDAGAAFVALLTASRCYYDGLFAVQPFAERDRIRNEVVAQLGSAIRRMAPDAVDSTVNELIRRRLRASDPVLDPQRLEEGSRTR